MRVLGCLFCKTSVKLETLPRLPKPGMAFKRLIYSISSRADDPDGDSYGSVEANLSEWTAKQVK